VGVGTDLPLDPDASRRVGRVASVAVLIGLAAAVIAGATIWLVLTDPVTVANALVDGEISPLVEQLAEVIYNVLVSLLAYL
jgi:multidrug resistance efflux pump